MASNSAGFVRELQEYLRTVALFHGQSTALQITGVYDESTRRAVKSFQKDHNLPVTGDTDLNTWETLLLAHRQILHETALPRPLHLFPAGQFQLSSGSSGSLVAAMQMILQTLGERYSNFPSVDLSASYDESTRLAVLFIQGSFFVFFDTIW